MSDHTAAIRALVEHRFPDATPVSHRTAELVATGIEVPWLLELAEKHPDLIRDQLMGE